MKILFFIDTFSAGGKERRLIELMKGLKFKPNIQFALAIMNEDVHYKELFDLDIEIHYILRKTKKDILVFSKVYNLCKNYKPDIVQCWDSMTAVYVVPTVKLLGIKFLNGMVADAPSKLSIKDKTWLRAKLTFPFSNMIIANSKAGLKAYKVPARKSICINNGFNFCRIESILEASLVKKQLEITTRFIVGMVASFSIFKDYNTFFSASQILLEKRRDITFVVIGTDTDSANCKKMVNGKFENNFRLLGKRSDIESYINIMDICVLSTFTEGISNSILEYMSLSKPVIATDGGGTNEIIEHEKTGYLVNVSNPQELAERIEILLNDGDLRSLMGNAGRERIINHFSIHKMVDSFVECYNKLLAKKQY